MRIAGKAGLLLSHESGEYRVAFRLRERVHWNLSIYLSIYLSIIVHMNISQFINIVLRRSYLPIYLSIYLSIIVHLSIWYSNQSRRKKTEDCKYLSMCYTLLMGQWLRNLKKRSWYCGTFYSKYFSLFKINEFLECMKIIFFSFLITCLFFEFT